jgi:hypothetical protein
VLELLARVPFPLADIDRQFRFEEQAHLDRFLTAGDPEGLPGVALGVKVGGAGEGASRRLDPAEPNSPMKSLLLGR